MGKFASRARQPLIAAFVVAVVGQVLLIWFGNALPDSADLFGAPYPAGASVGYGGGQFWLSDWVFDVLVTFAVLAVGASVHRGKTVPGVIAAGVAVLVGYTTYLLAALLRQGPYNSTNQLVIWAWMLIVVLSVWGISRYRRGASAGVGRRVPSLTSNIVTRARPYLWTALVVGGLAQFLITSCGSLGPYKSDLYGAPIPVGETTPDVLFGNNPTFFPPFFVLNIVLTAALLLAAATLLKGTMKAGLISASVAVLAAYLTVLALRSGSELRANQLVIWVWVLLVVSAVWWIRRSRREQVKESTTPI